MDELLQPLTSSVQELTNEGIPIKIEIPVPSALLLGLALVIPIIVWFALKRISK